MIDYTIKLVQILSSLMIFLLNHRILKINWKRIVFFPLKVATIVVIIKLQLVLKQIFLT
jgi:hypothetical protein